MPPSPPFEIPKGREGQDLAGVQPCGCITAALAVRERTTQKDVRDFYADMGASGREVRWMPVEDIRKALFGTCAKCKKARAAA